jgi:hypothetical protein
MPLSVGDYWVATVIVARELGVGGVWDILRLPCDQRKIYEIDLMIFQRGDVDEI